MNHNKTVLLLLTIAIVSTIIANVMTNKAVNQLNDLFLQQLKELENQKHLQQNVIDSLEGKIIDISILKQENALKKRLKKANKNNRKYETRKANIQRIDNADSLEQLLTDRYKER